MARRLPIYLLLDVSENKACEPIVVVERDVQTMVAALKNDPLALELNTYVSVITFASEVNQVVPLTDLCQLELPQLTIGGGAALGAALSYVTECAEREVVKNTAEAKGDLRPLVFIFSNGRATDSIESGLANFHKRRWGGVVACAVSRDADMSALEKITETVVKPNVVDSTLFCRFLAYT